MVGSVTADVGAQATNGTAPPAEGAAVRDRRAPRPAMAMLVGAVLAADTERPVPDVQVEVVGTGVAVRTNADGRFVLRGLASGAHVLRVRRVGFRPVTLPVVAGAAGAPLAVLLERAAVPLARMVVTPGQYGVLRDGTASAQTVSREQLTAAPQVGEDLFRIVGRLPGLSTSDYSAAFRVRGGAHEELLVTLDGLELIEPFHLKDFDGALSIVDLGVVGGLDLNTGGFGARYGDRLTGVMEIRTMVPEPGPVQAEAALTLTALRANARGTFADGRGGWLWSARRGFLEYALRMASEEDVRPRYHDTFGKLTFQPAPGHDVALHVLYAGDRMHFAGDTVRPRLTSDYVSSYAWATWRARLGERLTASTVLSAGRLGWRRAGDGESRFDDDTDLRLRDERGFASLSLRQDWALEQSPRAVLAFGVRAERLAARYDYARARREPVADRGRLAMVESDTALAAAPVGTSLGAYASQRLRIGAALTTEAGLRLDRQVRTNGASSVAEWHWSPRLAAAYALGDRTTLRAAWGRYWQAQGVHELQVQDGAHAFAPGELAEHRVLGVERLLPGGASARLEAYERRTLRVRPRYRGVDMLELFPEIGRDRRLVAPTDGLARGVELLVRRDRPTGLSWSTSYVLARADERVDGRRTPRPLDQRHTVTADAVYRPSAAWMLSAAWTHHTGWPVTGYDVAADTLPGDVVLYERLYEARNGDRLPAYHRLDLRVTRRFAVAGGQLAAFVDVFNVYDRRYRDAVLPRLPSFGISWER